MEYPLHNCSNSIVWSALVRGLMSILHVFTSFFTNSRAKICSNPDDTMAKVMTTTPSLSWGVESCLRSQEMA